ncbi:MAG TPA: hypothetical protein VL463_37145 [Kofleriaceae bacterium]|jgi:hypothetical protein|nr:hypothetical protein [Kofleriaceae bacterium]
MIDGQAAIADASSYGRVDVVATDPDNPGVAILGTRVFFIAPNGEVIANVLADLYGNASADVPPGSSVTVLWPPATLETVMGVMPGDHLRFADFAATAPLLDPMKITFPASSSAVEYELYNPCGWSHMTSNLSDDVVCNLDDAVKPGTYFVAAISTTSPVTPFAVVEKDGVPYAPGGTLDLQGPWQPLVDCTSAHSDIPTGYTTVSQRFVASTLGFSIVRDLVTSQSGTSTFAGKCAPTTMPSLERTWVYPQRNTQAYQHIFESVAATDTSYTIDVAQNLLPWMEAPTLDLATGKVTIAVDGSADVDVFVLDVSYTREPSGTFFHWYVIAPAIADITLPRLPDELGINPRTTDEFGTSRATAYDWAGAKSYADVRPDFERWITSAISAGDPHSISRYSVSDLGY